MREKSPKEAVKLLEEALLYARKDGDVQAQAEAYTLLGNIYEDINQPELALQRYQQALNALSPSDEKSKKKPSKANLPGQRASTNPAPIHQRMGQLYLDLKNDEAAATSSKSALTNQRTLGFANAARSAWPMWNCCGAMHRPPFPSWTRWRKNTPWPGCRQYRGPPLQCLYPAE